MLHIALHVITSKLKIYFEITKYRDDISNDNIGNNNGVILIGRLNK
jgi:hypothetical protein